MKKVIIKYSKDKISEGYEKIFDNVTKFQCFCSLGFFDNYIVIYQGEEITTVMMCDLEEFEVID